MAKLKGEDLKQFKADLAEINRLRAEIESKPLQLAATDDNLENLPGLLADAKQAVYDLEDSVEGLRGRWEGVIGEIKKSNDISKESYKSFSKLTDVAQKLQHHQRGSNELSSKELRSLVNRQKIEQENLKYQQAALSKKVASGEATQDEVNSLKEVNAQLDKENGLVGATLKKTQELLKQQRNIEKATGLTGVAMKGIASFTEKIGMGDMGNVFEDAAEAAKASASRLTDGGKKAGGFITKVRAMGSAFKVVGKAIVQNLTDPLVVAGMLIKGFKSVFSFFSDAYKEGKEAAMVISDENTNMARSLGLAQGAANKLASSVAGMGPTTAASKASIEGIYEAMGSTEKLSNNTLRVFVKLNTQAGMSAESLAKFQKFAKLSGQDAGVLVKNMANTALETIKTNKYAFSQKNLLNDVANVSSTVALRFKDQPAALVKAVAKAKSLGIEMGKIEDIAGSLLNFEDSIAAEMEAELLTGKQLNLEKAREAALRGDTAALQDEIISQLGSIEEFNKMNVIQQDAFAKSIGLSRGELAGMLDAQQKNKNTGDDLVGAQQDGLAAMTSEVSKREQEENRARKAAEANIAVYKELQPLVDSLRDTWAEIKKIVMDTLAENVLKPMMEFFKSEEGKNFLKELPGRVKKFTDGLITGIKAIRDFIKEHPKISMAVLGGAVVAKPLTKALGGLLSGDIKGGAMDAMGIERGTAANPMIVEMAGGGGMQDQIMDMVSKNSRASFAKQFKTLFTKPKVMFRALAMKGKGFGRIIGKLGTKFGGFTKSLSGFVGKLGTKFGGLTKALSSFGKGLKNAIKSLSGGIGNALKKGWNAIKGGAKKLLGGAKSMGSKALGGAKSAWGSLKSMAGNAWKGAKSMGSKALSGAKTIGSKALSGVKQAGNFVASKAGNITGWFKNNTKRILPKLLRGSKGALKGALKRVPFVGGIIEAIDAGMDINELAKSQNMSKDEIYSQIGKRTIGGGLGVIFGSIAAALVSSLQAVGIPGWLMSTIAFAGGDWLGKKLGSAISDYVGGPALGKGIFNTFYSGKGAGKADDMYSGYGKRILLHPEGSIALNDKDTVIAGTNLFRGDDVVSGPAGSMVSNSAVLAKLDKLIAAIEKGGTVVLDGQKVGEALVAGSYRMQ